MRHPLLSRVRRTIAEHRLADPGTRVLVALSGGPDSVALARIVRELATAGELVFAGVAHFNHQLRATASRDEEFCRAFARSLGVPFEFGGADVAALARDSRQSIETAAHDARYGFLETARQRIRADVVAIGHTRDDQAETFLLRLLRGAGPRGLAAMHPRHGVVIRPLLDCRRADLLAWLEDRGQPFTVDESNADSAVPRNRIRAVLMPLLESAFNPAIVEVLAGEAALARDDWEWLERTADQTFARIANASGQRIEIDTEELLGTPVALRRAVIWRALSRLTGRPVGFDHVAAVLALAGGARSEAELHLPGQIVKRLGGRLVLLSRGPAMDDVAPARTNLFAYSLSIPGEVLVPEANGVLTAGETRPAEGGQTLEGVVRRDLCGNRLTVRNRRPGDRLRPAGLGGRKKLQDLFVDRKVARRDRDRIPLVIDETGRIVWVAGIAIAEEFRITDPAQPMLILRFKVLGGSD